ncbi:MAG: Wzz/FepE/Etk N-terminal domain-containing protein [Cyclobacteriaceae bacterium]
MQNNDSQRDEIDLVEVLLVFWRERKVIYISVVIFVMLGVLKTCSTPDEYTSEVKLMPESNVQNNMGGFARQFGISLPNNTEQGIPSRYYPDITKSLPFIIPLMQFEVIISGTDEKITLYEYILEYKSQRSFIQKSTDKVKKYTIFLPFTILDWITGSNSASKDEPSFSLDMEDDGQEDKNNQNNVLSLTKSEWSVVRELQNSTGLDIDRESGIITISSSMPNPVIAAMVADKVTSLLAKYIKEYKTEKAKVDFLFVENRFEEAKADFNIAQERLARFRDENRGQLTQTARIEEQRLQSQYDLSFNVYNVLAGRLEEARINLQQETPVINIIEPASVPTQISSPKRNFILILYFVLGIFFGFIFIFLRILWKKIRRQL